MIYFNAIYLATVRTDAIVVSAYVYIYIIITIIIILGIIFMQGIYTSVLETNHLSREHRVAAVLVLLFMLLILLVPALTPLYLYVSTFIIIIIIIVIIIIIIIPGISFMQGIYTYISETNHVPKEHRVAAVLVLLFMVLILLVPALTPLYLYLSTFIIIITIIIILGISFMQGIYTYISETNHAPKEHSVAAILVLLFMVLISLVPALTPLYLYVSTFIIIIIIIIIILGRFSKLSAICQLQFQSLPCHIPSIHRLKSRYLAILVILD